MCSKTATRETGSRERLAARAKPIKNRSPREIHARWGEPEDVEQFSVCTDFEPNPFKLGFCRNCQRQHNVTSTGHVDSYKVSNKISRPPVGGTTTKTSPPQEYEERESDVDLTALLRERRKLLIDSAPGSKPTNRGGRGKKNDSSRNTRTKPQMKASAARTKTSNRSKGSRRKIEDEWL